MHPCQHLMGKGCTNLRTPSTPSTTDGRPVGVTRKITQGWRGVCFFFLDILYTP